METITFEKTIKCSGCVEKISPHLNEAGAKEHWKVGINDPFKILTIDGETNESKIKEALQKVGYFTEWHNLGKSLS